MDTVTRGVYRCQLTKLANAASEYLSAETSMIKSANASNFDNIEEELTVFIERLSSVADSLDKANAEIRDSIKSDDFKKEAESIVEYSDKAVSVLARLKQRLAKLQKYQQREAPHTVNSSNNGGSANDKNPSASKLPKLTLKTFSGDFREWLPFWEVFRTSVHERTDLNGAEKFNYLQLHLKGNAANSLAGFIPSEENYHAAISMLQEEYGDQEKLVDFMMQQLMSLTPATSKNDANGLRQLYNGVTANTRSLTALGVPSSQYSVMLKSQLLRCMPNDLVVDFYRTHQNVTDDLSTTNERQNTDPSEIGMESMLGDETSSVGYSGDRQVRDILKFLKREVESLERTAQLHIKRATTTTRSGSTLRKTTMGLFTPDVKRKCCFCKADDHDPQQCKSTLTLAKRKELLKADGRCFRCMKKGHSSRFCKNRSLKCERCSGRHLSIMCDPTFQSNTIKPPSSEMQYKPPDSSNKGQTLQSSGDATNLCSPISPSSDVYLQTACVLVSNSTTKKSMSLRIILDGGSQRSYITQSIANKLALEVVDHISIRILPFGSAKETPSQRFARVRVVLKSKHDDQYISILAVVVPNICLDVLPVPNANCPSLENLCLADSSSYHLEEVGLSVLVGSDYYWRITAGKIIRLTSDTVAVKSMFGWLLQGPVFYECKGKAINQSLCTAALNIMSEEESCVKSFWDLESIGITAENKNRQDVDYDKYVRRVGNRMEGSLLWHAPGIILDSFQEAALIRFRKLVNKLLRQPQMFLRYEDAMWDLISSGIAERVNNDIIPENAYYMPHHPVLKDESSTTQLRIVFDGSAHTHGNLSLNAALSPGPNLLPDVLSVLLNFRAKKVALVADIEKAFLQLLLSSSDRDFHRFYWFAQRAENTKQLPEIVVYRMTRVTFGVSCSPFLLCAALRKLFTENLDDFPETCKVLMNSFYMDDLVTSVDDAETATKIYRDTGEILKRASMKIRKWNSNHSAVRDSFNDESPESQKVLGITWNHSTDYMAIDVKNFRHLSQQRATKRNVLRFITSIYDPVGLLGPYVIKLKILFQEIWRQKIGWDEQLPPELETIWNVFTAQVNFLEDTAVPRCIFSTDDVSKRELHLFADASMSAYGVVAYARCENNDNHVTVNFLCSKNRVAPLKTSSELTLPKLELTAALLAARLADYIKRNLNVEFDCVYLWSDSKITLHWINSDTKKFKPYISHRVIEIRRLTSSMCWRHCPGIENPADMLTRGINGKDLLQSSLWIPGPPWLRCSADNWPEGCFVSNTQICSASLQALEEDEGPPESLIELERFSNYRKLLRTIAYVLRFIDALRGRRPISKFLLACEVQKAEQLLIKFTQRTHYYKEIAALTQNQPIPKQSSILQLNPTIDENGILRMHSRLQESGLDYNEIFPILLPKTAYFTRLLIFDLHTRTLHGGVNVTLSRLRERFWIVKARQLIKSIVNSCRVCARYKAKPALQPFAPLPRDRLQFARPFEAVGVDFAGPLYVKDDKIGQSLRKVYIMLVTCAAIRAVHLELVSSLSTEDCLRALRRFFARRGLPKVIYSDNARTFKRAALELRGLAKVIQSECLQDFITENGITWNFIVERAAWWGGFWERLIKDVKKTLKFTIHRSTITVEELQTLLVEVEGVMNSRPLTYISDDPVDLSPLTPNHFLAGTSRIINNVTTIEDKSIRAAWKNRLKLLSTFSKRFTREYIQRLRSAHYQNNEFTKMLEIGDVVILYDNFTPRTFWKLAIVEKTFPGRDGKIRACEIRLANGTILRRPIQQLYPLELKSNLSARPEDVENISK